MPGVSPGFSRSTGAPTDALFVRTMESNPLKVSRLELSEAGEKRTSRSPSGRRRSAYNRPVALDPGTPFPRLELRDEEGQVAEVPPGETLYGFFKTTCPTCELAWPYLDRIRRIGEGGSLSIWAVSQDEPGTTRSFYEGLGVRIPTLYDAEPWTASEALGLSIVPTFLIVGSDGVLRDSAVGFQRDKMEEFADLAARLAGRPPAALFSPDENVPAWKPG